MTALDYSTARIQSMLDREEDLIKDVAAWRDAYKVIFDILVAVDGPSKDLARLDNAIRDGIYASYCKGCREALR